MIVISETPEKDVDIRIAATRKELGRIAASDIAAELRACLRTQLHLRMIFAAAPSQAEMLRALVAEPGIDWHRITAFHVDEYIGLRAEAPQGFGMCLREAIFDRVPLAKFHLIHPERELKETCHSYARKLQEAPIDVVLLGIGVNGHLAFNDPPEDLHDPSIVKVVTLDELCRHQQLEDACFPEIDEITRMAITLTVPVLLSGNRIFCCVPGANKRRAVLRMLHDPISGACPATALRTHPRCTIYLYRDSSAELK